MMKSLRKSLSLVLALALMLALLPLPEGNSALAVGSYGKVTADGVKVRKQPSTSAVFWFKLDTGYVCELLDTTTSGGVTWYKVNAVHPDPDSNRTYVGYIHGDYFTPLNDDEAAAWEGNPVQPGSSGTAATAAPTATPTPNADGSVVTAAPATAAPADGTSTTASSGATGQVTNGGVNFRETEGGYVLAKLDRGTVVELLTIPSVIDSNHWYCVRYDGVTGYIQAPFIRVLTNGGGATATTEITTAPAVTSAPATGYGYAKLLLSSANLRKTPGGKVGAQWETPGGTLAIVGPSTQQSGYVWYPVSFLNETYYVRGDCIQVVSSENDAATATPAIVTATPVPGETATPAPGATATPVTSTYGYVRTTAGGINLRLQPDGGVIQQVDKDLILPMLSAVVIQSGYGWYYVDVNGIKGYLRGDCVQVCNADGSDVTGTTSPGNGSGIASEFGYVKLTEDKVNLRTKPAGTMIEQLALGSVLPMTAAAVKSGAYTWYPVRATSGRTGYVRGDCLYECDQDGTASGSSATATPTPEPGTTAAPTTAPSVSSYGYIKVTSPKVNLRKAPAGAKIGVVEDNTVWPMTGDSVSKSGYTWYPIQTDTLTGYIRGDCCFKLSATQQESYLAGNGVPAEETGGNSGTTTASTYLITTVDKVNLRASPSKDASAPYNVALSTVMAYNTTQTVGGTLWYRVVYSNTEVWVLGSCVRVMTDAEYQTWLQSQPVTTPQPEVVVGYVITTSNGVNLRTTANGASIIGRIDKGVVMAYSKEPEVVRNYTWYYVKSPNNGYGYVRGDCVSECDSNGGALATATPAPTTTGSTSGTAGQEASYTTLKKGSTGTAVKALVAELKAQGYYTGSITSTYTTAVETAVKAFQKANGLTADGIAGSDTQHKLFGTVPIGSTDTSNLTMTIYPAEKIDWYTGGIQELWPKGANYKVYDVKTGIVWTAHRWSGGQHVDAEPLTAADTARLCRTYGVSNADQISSQNLWQRRPLLVTIGTRTFACSLYGVPHNYPEGDTISTNNYKGQLCIHFTNSKTHASNKVDSYHTEAIQYAIDHAPNGHL